MVGLLDCCCGSRYLRFGRKTKPPAMSRYRNSVDGKAFSRVLRERIEAMKAVDPLSLQNCPQDPIMVPNPEVPEDLTSERLKGKLRAKDSPVRTLNDTKHQNGVKEGDQCAPKIVENGLLHLKLSNEERRHIPNSLCHNGTATKQNANGCVHREFPSNGVCKKGENGVRDGEVVLGDGALNNGYCADENESLESLTDGEGEEGKREGATPPEDIPGITGYQLLVDSGLESAASSWDRAVAEAEDRGSVVRLQQDLRHAKDELKLRDEEVTRLTRIRQDVEGELEELTASLFQEAHAMVRTANERQAAAERALKESAMQAEVLNAEVAALKALVLTSTPSRPNPHLHPQIDPRANMAAAAGDSGATGTALFRKHRRSPSHYNLKYGRENSPPESPSRDPHSHLLSTQELMAQSADSRDGLEVDPVLHREFLAWREAPSRNPADTFMARIYKEDIDTCLTFSNEALASEVRSAVESGTVYIEAVNDKSKTHFPKRCALLEAPRQCQYRMRLGETDTWHSISHMCRNRIIAVCDFLNYLNYIERGLVKSSAHDVYWEIIRLRKEMVLARLGLPLSA